MTKYNPHANPHALFLSLEPKKESNWTMAEAQVRKWSQTIGLSPLIRADSGLLQGGGTEGIRRTYRAPLHRGGIWYGS